MFVLRFANCDWSGNGEIALTHSRLSAHFVDSKFAKPIHMWVVIRKFSYCKWWFFSYPLTSPVVGWRIEVDGGVYIGWSRHRGRRGRRGREFGSRIRRLVRRCCRVASHWEMANFRHRTDSFWKGKMGEKRVVVSHKRMRLISFILFPLVLNKKHNKQK